MNLYRTATRTALAAGCLAAIVLSTGCSLFHHKKADPAPQPTATAPSGSDTNHLDRFRISDEVKIDFSGTPNQMNSVQTQVKEDGTIVLDLIGKVQAAGKTAGELEREIQDKYVPDYYTHLTATVTPAARFFYVDGQINGGGGGGRIAYSGPITVTRAIAAAGGFNPYADRKHVRLIRLDGRIEVVNCLKALDHPELDLPVYPGDKVYVKMRLF